MSTLRPSHEDEDNYKAGTVDDDVYEAAREYIKTMTMIFEKIPEETQRLTSEFLTSDYNTSVALTELEEILGLEPIDVDQLNQNLAQKEEDLKIQNGKFSEGNSKIGSKRKREDESQESSSMEQPSGSLLTTTDQINKNKAKSPYSNSTGKGQADLTRDLTDALLKEFLSQNHQPTHPNEIFGTNNTTTKNTKKDTTEMANQFDPAILKVSKGNLKTAIAVQQEILNLQKQNQSSSYLNQISSLESDSGPNKNKRINEWLADKHNIPTTEDYVNAEDMSEIDQLHIKKANNLKNLARRTGDTSKLNNKSQKYLDSHNLNFNSLLTPEAGFPSDDLKKKIPNLIDTIVNESENVKNLINKLETNLKIYEDDAELFRTNFLREWVLGNDSESEDDPCSKPGPDPKEDENQPKQSLAVPIMAETVVKPVNSPMAEPVLATAVLQLNPPVLKDTVPIVIKDKPVINNISAPATSDMGGEANLLPKIERMRNESTSSTTSSKKSHKKEKKVKTNKLYEQAKKAEEARLLANSKLAKQKNSLSESASSVTEMPQSLLQTGQSNLSMANNSMANLTEKPEKEKFSKRDKKERDSEKTKKKKVSDVDSEVINDNSAAYGNLAHVSSAELKNANSEPAIPEITSTETKLSTHSSNSSSGNSSTLCPSGSSGIGSMCEENAERDEKKREISNIFNQAQKELKVLQKAEVKSVVVEDSNGKNEEKIEVEKKSHKKEKLKEKEKEKEEKEKYANLFEKAITGKTHTTLVSSTDKKNVSRANSSEKKSKDKRKKGEKKHGEYSRKMIHTENHLKMKRDELESTSEKLKKNLHKITKSNSDKHDKHEKHEKIKYSAANHHVHNVNSKDESFSDENLNAEEDNLNDIYCICRKISYGEMVACDNLECSIEWFHFPCVKLKHKPVGKWYCPECKPKKLGEKMERMKKLDKMKKNENKKSLVL